MDDKTNRNQNPSPRRSGAGPDVAEGAAWVGGGAAGAVVGSALGPIGTVAGAAIGGALADEAVENTQATGSMFGNTRTNNAGRNTTGAGMGGTATANRTGMGGTDATAGTVGTAETNYTSTTTGAGATNAAGTMGQATSSVNGDVTTGGVRTRSHQKNTVYGE